MTSIPRVPRDVVAGLEARPVVPVGSDDRFAGYAILGVRFASGDILALRRFPASSVGPGYTSVWHRSPDRRWIMYQDIDVHAGCGKYFSSAVETIREAPIRVVWTGADRFSVFVGRAEPITWDVQLGATALSRALSSLAAFLPASLFRVPVLARAVGSAAGALLGAGALTLTGSSPNGFRFIAQPEDVWFVAASRAVIGSRPAGAVVTGDEDVLLGDFRIPRRGLFAIARAVLRPGAGAVAGFAGGSR